MNNEQTTTAAAMAAWCRANAARVAAKADDRTFARFLDAWAAWSALSRVNAKGGVA
jgi:hypothetical protein